MSNPKDYTVGWICAISTEYVAAKVFLDEIHDGPEYVSPNDSNDYTLGKVGKHNVVIAVLPDGEYGTSSAASVARDMLHSFPSVRIGLMVGIGGGAPSPRHDIRLGDIVVSAPRDEKGGVFQYDFGKTIQDHGFRPAGFLNQPPMVLRTALNGLKAQYESDGHHLEEAINSILEKKPRLRKKYKRPDPSSDRLYQPRVTHPLNDQASCATVCGDDPLNLILRPERTEDEDNPAIHFGLIASANQLMKDALVRDQLAAEKDVLCFEMEAAGLMNHFPCLVIRGVCDYSDSHKNKEWQGYAAMVAAAYTKDLLCRIPPNKVEAENKISDLLSGVLENVSRTGVNVEMMRSKLDRNEDLKILNWLTPIDYGPQQSDCIRRRQAGTGQWLLRSGKFQTWLKTSKQTLFCPGIPGAGKTILTSVVVDDLITRFENNPIIGIAYIYCNFRRREEQKAENLLASLLKQLSQGQSSLPDNVKALYDQHEKKRTRPLLDEISRALQSVAAMYSRIFIIIDALDECQGSDASRERFLLEMFNLQAKCGANLLVTSRFIPEITEKFKKSERLEIRASEEDIRTYLDYHTSPRRAFLRKNRKLLEEIKAQIVEAVEGMFLLAQLHLDSLMGKTTEDDIRSALEVLPTRSKAYDQVYDQAYNDAMERIKEQDTDGEKLAKQILSWITCARRPLITAELQHALAVKVGESQFNEKRRPDIEDMVSVCAGLVTVDEESNIIRLIHYTTQEYFERTQMSWFPDAQRDVASTCITYLLFDTFEAGFCQTDEEFETRLQLNPLYDYAAQNWGHHARAASTVVEQMVLTLLYSEAKTSGSSQAMMAIANYYGYSQRVPRRMTGIHLAAYFGLRQAMVALLRNRHDPNSKDSYDRTPLWWAARNGHEAVVELLLANNGVDPNSKNKYGRTPLWWAARNGHEAVVELLLAKEGVDPNSKETEYGQTPLWQAVENGYEAVVGQLLAKDGVDPDSKDIYRRTPLSLATVKGHEAVVKLLLAKERVDLNSKDNNGQTPLSRAAEKGHEAVVKLLLERGVDLESNDKDGGQPPLSWAARNGHEAVVRLLLEKGADLEPKDKDGGQSPLSWAARNGHEAVVRLLLERGADLESKDTKHGQTPLSWAAEEGHEAVVKLLLESGADVVPKDTLYSQTPLSWAVGKGHEAAVKLLLESGANVESKDTLYGRTPLLWAAQKGYEAVVKLLLESGADVESKDTLYGQTPLLWAAEKGHEAVVKLLLEKGADVESKDTVYGQTPLSWAAWKGHRAIVKLLLEQR